VCSVWLNFVFGAHGWPVKFEGCGERFIGNQATVDERNPCFGCI
jgi:hypothetical protein